MATFSTETSKKIHGSDWECVDILLFFPWVLQNEALYSHTESSGMLYARPLHSNHINNQSHSTDFLMESLPNKKRVRFLFVFLVGQGEVKILPIFSSESE
jgi:hypothetical protein